MRLTWIDRSGQERFGSKTDTIFSSRGGAKEALARRFALVGILRVIEKSGESLRIGQGEINHPPMERRRVKKKKGE